MDATLSVVASTIQAAGVLALATLVALVARSLGAAWLRSWATAWLWLAGSLVALQVSFRQPGAERLLQAAYHFGELAFLWLLARGSREFRGLSRPGHARVWAAAAAALSLALPWTLPEFTHRFVVQATLLSAGFLWNAAVLWPARSLPGTRLGVGVALVALVLLSAMFAAHAAAFGAASIAGSGLPLAYAAYSSLYDLLLEMLLAFGMVVVGLQDAAGQIRTLAGLVPICAWCRKLRDDQGYWSEFETWARRHTGARVTHGICPACKEKHFPELA